MSGKIISFILAAILLCSLVVFTSSCADAAAAEIVQKEQPIPLVIGMGIGVVFFGLICIVILSLIMSAIVRATDKKSEAAQNAASPSVPAPAVVLSPEKRRELIAAISAVIAEELGKDVSAIRVTSFRKL